MLAHSCEGVTCNFPSCQNNPNNRVRHRTGLRHMTLAEFRRKYGTNGVSEIITYLIEHIPLSAQSLKDFKELASDIKSLLTED